MKINYEKPVIKVEELERKDILLRSEQTDNQHVDSQQIVDTNFSVERLLM